VLLIDAGPLYAAIDRDDAHHEASVDLLTHHPGPLLVPTLVITEVAYFVGTRLGSETEVRLAQDFAEGNLIVEPVHAGDWIRIAELVHTYRDLELGMVDASLVATAERHGLEEIASLDHRHLGVVRPRHVPRLRLLP